mgnify:CR=1 FL=1
MKNKVFFNNSCNICRAEINHYKKYSNQDIEWVDVTNNKQAQQITSKSYEQLLRRMHVIPVSYTHLTLPTTPYV